MQLTAKFWICQTCCLWQVHGEILCDSTPIRTCKTKRINSNKVFRDIVNVGGSIMGWFYGFIQAAHPDFRLQELLDFVISHANEDDRVPLKQGNILKRIFGSLLGDKGYISKELSEMLFDQGLHLVTGIRNNMKNVLMCMRDKILLRKGSVIETINDQPKNIWQAEHSRHRSFGNFLTNLVARLIAYSFQEKKPGIKFEKENISQLVLFY